MVRWSAEIDTEGDLSCGGVRRKVEATKSLEVSKWPRKGDDFTDHDLDEFELRGAVKVRFTSLIFSIPH